MAKIFPFRGVTYSTTKIGKDLSQVVTQPYDRIFPDRREEYYKRSEFNFVKIVLGHKFATDDEYYNYYTRSTGYLNHWFEQGILEKAKQPAIYAYHQEFKVDGEIVIRKGFVALAELEAPGKGVKAHEKTLAGPKADRLNLTRHIRAQVGHIFMLYSDPARTADMALDKAIEDNEPDMIATDWFGNIHKMWAITDTETIRIVQDTLSDKTLFIADGHHRYETAVNYWQECEGKGLKPAHNATETFKNRMMTLINMDDPGLVVLPTHRVIHSVENYNLDKFLTDVKVNFDVEEFEFLENTSRNSTFDEVFGKMGTLGLQNKHAFVFAPKNVNKFYLLVLKDEAIMDRAISQPLSATWKRLDVSILHKLLLEDLLGIDAKALEEKRNLYYIRAKEQGFEYLDKDPKVQGVFYINPTKVGQVKDIASAGERMPQKSTDFYPKLLTGMVINKLEFGE